MITALSAITLATRDMGAAVRFYRAAGFEMLYGGETAGFTSFRAGNGFLNLIAQPARIGWWGRAIFYESDVDGLYARLVAAGFRPQSAPRDAEWGERFFQITDPDGHEISFAWPSNAKIWIRLPRTQIITKNGNHKMKLPISDFVIVRIFNKGRSSCL
ncbi:MAG TPA: VOC family protein [Stellaceae bacterium]|nr:VOC family protein [Stellaceae bacterium]